MKRIHSLLSGSHRSLHRAGTCSISRGVESSRFRPAPTCLEASIRFSRMCSNFFSLPFPLPLFRPVITDCAAPAWYGLLSVSLVINRLQQVHIDRLFSEWETRAGVFIMNKSVSRVISTTCSRIYCGGLPKNWVFPRKSSRVPALEASHFPFLGLLLSHVGMKSIHQNIEPSPTARVWMLHVDKISSKASASSLWCCSIPSTGRQS